MDPKEEGTFFVYCACVILMQSSIVDKSDCGVHINSVSIDSCSLRPICAEQWHPTVISLNRVGRSLHCAWKFPWVSRNKQVVRSLVG